MHKDRYIEIFKNAEDNLSQFHSKVDRENQKLSLKEVIGEDVYTEWLDSPQGINLRCKFETLGVHTNEMQKYNNNETGWVEYNFLNCDLGIKGYYTPQDISKEALKVAKINAKLHHLENKIKFFNIDIDKFNSNKYDLIISNPPYINIVDLNRLDDDVRLYEPVCL